MVKSWRSSQQARFVPINKKIELNVMMKILRLWLRLLVFCVAYYIMILDYGVLSL